MKMRLYWLVRMEWFAIHFSSVDWRLPPLPSPQRRGKRGLSLVVSNRWCFTLGFESNLSFNGRFHTRRRTNLLDR